MQYHKLYLHSPGGNLIEDFYKANQDALKRAFCVKTLTILSSAILKQMIN